MINHTQRQTTKYCVLYVARHGETEWNVQRRVQGHKDSPLTDLGLEQARQLARSLLAIHFDAVFSSDLLRAKRTAEIVALERKIAVDTSQLLREHNYGKYEGRLADDLREELKEIFEKYEKLSDDEKFRYTLIPGGESDEKLVSRFITFVREIAVVYAGKTALVVTHGGLMSAFLTHAGFARTRKVRVSNAGYFKLLSDGVDFFIHETNGITILE